MYMGVLNFLIICIKQTASIKPFCGHKMPIEERIKLSTVEKVEKDQQPREFTHQSAETGK